LVFYFYGLRLRKEMLIQAGVLDLRREIVQNQGEKRRETGGITRLFNADFGQVNKQSECA
jgi:hypothetical protein